MFSDPEEEHPTKGARRVPAHDVPLKCARGGHALHGESFFFFAKGVVRVVQTAPPPLSPPMGFGTYNNCALKTSMIRPAWGPTSNSGRELTPGYYALEQKYHLPCPPSPLQKGFPKNTCLEVITVMRRSFYMLGSGASPPPLPGCP